MCYLYILIDKKKKSVTHCKKKLQLSDESSKNLKRKGNIVHHSIDRCQ